MARDSRRVRRLRAADSARKEFDCPDDNDGLSTRSLVRSDKKTRLRTLDDLDGRTYAARLARSLVEELVADLGGVENLSAAQQLLVQRAAVLSAVVEDSEAKWLAGKQVDVGLLGTLGDRLRRMLESLGLERQPKFINATQRGLQILEHRRGV